MKKYFITSLLILSSQPLFAFDYFKSEIEYWKPATISENKEPVAANVPREEQKKEGSNFDWKKYMDPKNDTFFQEGDYKPPAPFMELVRNPTDANIKNWFTLIELKNKLSSNLQQRVSEYVEKSQPKLSTESRDSLRQKAASVQIDPDTYKQFRFRMYFDSKCPHCKRMMATLSELQSRGFYVELRQIDSDTSEAKDLPFPVEKASPSELKEKDIQSVPVTFVGDLKKKVVYRLTGFQTVQDIFEGIKNKKGFE
jgi:thiol-disulfide isomerase/thioredoxin